MRLIDKGNRLQAENLLNHYKQEGLISIGRYSYGVPEVVHDKYSDTKITIGSFCSIAEGLKIFNGSNHNVDWISTYPFRIMLDMEGKYKDGHPATKGDITIGHDVWIGQNVTILSGVSIGNGAVVAANSTVVKDVEPYTINGGSPAKYIKHRFSEEQISALQKIAWWEWDIEKIKANVPNLCSDNIDKFIANHE